MVEIGTYLEQDQVVIQNIESSPYYELYHVPEKYKGLRDGQKVEFKSKKIKGKRFAVSIRPLTEESISMSQMLTLGEVSKILGVHSHTVKAWSDKGILTAYRIGPRGDRRYRRDDILAYLNEHRQK
ncbi:MAG: helix-turn-helix domain-containing protein [Candidatus Aenigmatarchaeota archaeon]